MADLKSTYEQALNSVEVFLKQGIDVLSMETEGRLKTLREIFEILATIPRKRGDVNEEVSEVNQCIVLIVGFCRTFLFESYMEVLTQLSDRSKMVDEMENNQKEDKSSALPEVMKIKYDQVKRYLEKAKGSMEEIDKLLKSDSGLVRKMKEAARKRFNIPHEEIADLKMAIADVESELKGCKDFLDKAEGLISELQSDLNSEMFKYGVKVVLAAATGVAATVTVGGAALATSEICSLTLSTLTKALGRGGSISVVALAGVTLLVSVYSIIDKHKTSLNVHVVSLRLELEELQTDCNNLERKYKTKLTDNMAKKN